MKRCGHCKKTKPLDQFYRHSRQGDGLQPVCKDCSRNRERSLAANRSFVSWRAMRQRCSNPNDPKYADYGGRGIVVCSAWDGPDGFERFYADMGERPNGRTLGRIDNNGNYEPSNCRWATSSEQRANQRPARR